ncbi:MAG: hypothetical protein IPL01_24285 [Acidobacteria bacterium]|nr:hypothetical protein [Acidobacteriota bacterium]
MARATQLRTLAPDPSMNAQSMKVLSKKESRMKEVKEDENAKKATTVTSVSEGISGLAPRSMQNRSNKIATLDGMSSVVEPRMLRTSVLLSTAGNPPKTILITSESAR